MTKTIENDKLKITHDSGHVDFYTALDLKAVRDNFAGMRDALDADIAIIDNDIIQITGD